MKKELSCEIVKDLLPGYIDNKLSKETYELISNHLSNCKKCNEEYKNMSISIVSQNVDKRNIDFLKGIHKKSRNLLILSIIISCISFLASTFLCSKSTDNTIFILGLFAVVAILAVLKYALPLFCGIASMFLYKRIKKKWVYYYINKQFNLYSVYYS